MVGKQPVRIIPVNNDLDKGGCASSIISAILSVTHCLTEKAPAKSNFEQTQSLIYAVSNAITLGFKVVDRLKNSKDHNHEDIRVSCEECLSVIGKIKGKENLIPTITHHCYDDIFQDGCLEKIIDPIINQNIGSTSKFFHVC
jgi:hypothetical protein